jgi:hypothetical protein
MLIPVNLNPSRKQLRTFGVICVFVFSALGAMAFFKHKLMGFHLPPERSVAAAYLLWGLGGGSALLTAVAPPAMKPLYVALTVLTLPIGFVVSHLMMAVMYYVVVTPIGFAMRLFGWDPMTRRFEKSGTTYWSKRTSRKDAGGYLRQY